MTAAISSIFQTGKIKSINSENLMYSKSNSSAYKNYLWDFFFFNWSTVDLQRYVSFGEIF